MVELLVGGEEAASLHPMACSSVYPGRSLVDTAGGNAFARATCSLSMGNRCMRFKLRPPHGAALLSTCMAHRNMRQAFAGNGKAPYAMGQAKSRRKSGSLDGGAK